MWSPTKLNFPFYMFLWFTMIFQRFNQNKHKRKGEKPLPPQPKTAQGGFVNGFTSLRRLNRQFYCLVRKTRFGSKLRETTRTSSFRQLRKLMGQVKLKRRKVRLGLRGYRDWNWFWIWIWVWTQFPHKNHRGTCKNAKFAWVSSVYFVNLNYNCTNSYRSKF